MKKTGAILIAAALIFSAAASNANAGSKADHLAAGIIIGTGAALVGATLLHGPDRDRVYYRSPHRSYGPRGHIYQYRHRHPRSYHRYGPRYGSNWHHGYWVHKKIWIAPVYEDRWIEGHFTRNGRWVSGRQERVLIQEGRWVMKKIWIRD